MDCENSANSGDLGPLSINSDFEISDFEGSGSYEGMLGGGSLSLPTFTLQSLVEEAMPQPVDRHVNQLQAREGLQGATFVFSEHTR